MKTVLPSIFSVQVPVPVLLSPRDMPTVTTPVTVAPSVGLVMSGLGPGIMFETVTRRVALACAPAASRAVSTSVCAPSAPAVFQLKLAEVAAPEVVNT